MHKFKPKLKKKGKLSVPSPKESKIIVKLRNRAKMSIYSTTGKWLSAILSSLSRLIYNKIDFGLEASTAVNATKSPESRNLKKSDKMIFNYMSIKHGYVVNTETLASAESD